MTEWPTYRNEAIHADPHQRQHGYAEVHSQQTGHDFAPGVPEEPAVRSRGHDGRKQGQAYPEIGQAQGRHEHADAVRESSIPVDDDGGKDVTEYCAENVKGGEDCSAGDDKNVYISPSGHFAGLNGRWSVKLKKPD